MRFTFFLLLMSLASSALANITCKGAVDYAFREAQEISANVEKGEGGFEGIYDYLKEHRYRIADVKLACKNNFDARELFCGDYFVLTMKRPKLIAELAERQIITGKQSLQLQEQNFFLSDSIGPICDSFK